MSLNTRDDLDAEEAGKATALQASLCAFVTCRKPGNRALVISFIASIGFHCLALMFAIWAIRGLLPRYQEVGMKEEGIEGPLIAFIPADEPPQLTAPVVSYPNPALPVPEVNPHPATSETLQMAIENPDFMESISEPKAAPMQKPQSGHAEQAAASSRSKKEQTSPKSGTDGSAAHSDSAAGSRIGQKTGTETWHIPKPPYPASARALHIAGSGNIYISTNGSGSLAAALMTKRIHPLLDGNTRSYALANWKGPPNKSRDVPVIYRPE